MSAIRDGARLRAVVRAAVVLLVAVGACKKDAPQPAVDKEIEAREAVAAEALPARAALRTADPGIAAFWKWWGAVSLEDRLRVATGDATALQQELSRRVDAIHPNLAWEFGPGKTSEHALTLSGEGDPVGRLVAERWRRAGPPDGPHWSYFTTRQPADPSELLGLVIKYEGAELDFKGFVVVASEESPRPRLALDVWHPNLATLHEDARMNAAFVVLDNALGEDAVETWIGRIEVADSKPADGLDLKQLAEAVARREAEEAEPTFSLAEGKDPKTGARLVFTIDKNLRRWNHPFHDTWCDVGLAYAPNADGMPSNDDLERLQDAQEALLAKLGKTAVFAATATGNGARHIWLFVDGDSDALAQVAAWKQDYAGEVTVDAAFDPGWKNIPF